MNEPNFRIFRDNIKTEKRLIIGRNISHNKWFTAERSQPLGPRLLLTRLVLTVVVQTLLQRPAWNR